MTLLDVIRELESFDDEGIICAIKPWTGNSQAIVVLEPGARRLPVEAAILRMDYFLEVFIAREFLEDWAASLEAKPTVEAKRARLIRYAISDA